MSEWEAVAANLERVRSRIAAAAVAAGRPVEAVRLIAVSKTLPAAAVKAAFDAGQRDFGENRVEELVEKVPALSGEIRWHMIGHLQSRKSRDAIATAACIHSVDSAKLLHRLDRDAVAAGRRRQVLLQANVSGEASKSGVAPDELAPLLESAMGLAGVEVVGLMTMAPLDAAEADLHRVFAGLRIARDRLAEQFGTPLPELSMGMSGDFEAAIAEGATLVRIGTAIFGERHG